MILRRRRRRSAASTPGTSLDRQDAEEDPHGEIPVGRRRRAPASRSAASMEADSREVVETRLRSDGLIVGRVGEGVGSRIQITIGSGVSSKDLQIFTRQLATMIDAGLPLVQCLDILAAQTPNKIFARILAQVKSVGRAGRDVLRRAAQAPEGVRRALRQPRRRRRGRRHPRHDLEPPRGLHREGRQAARARSRARCSTRSASSSSRSASSPSCSSRSSRRSRTCTRRWATRELPAATQFVINLSHGVHRPSGTCTSAR